jgi:protein-tyrosine phosphatase
MRLPNGARLVVEGHAYASNTKHLEKFHAWVACAMEHTPYYYALSNKLTLWCPLDDCRPPRRGDVERALAASEFVAYQLEHGRHVLVTCAMGINRSALVAGLALRRCGLSGESAVAAIRRSRGNIQGLQALDNPYFLELVMG